ncbi:MAG: hypothetical protein N5P05_004557 (plasmid) [Chroococcopsis gigantea SAG 12.99]|nr:hypothetical protein [Chroococcopsis gigantea SAG 12.99]
MVAQLISFTIDPEFQSLIPPLTPLERQGLELSIVSSGCREPLIIWAEENILIDGHNRYAICVEQGIQYQVRAISLPDQGAVIDWIIANQLSRRNLSPFYMSYFRGKLYNREKSQGQRSDLTSGHSDQKLRVCETTTARKLAALHGVSEKTIRREGEYADAIDTLTEVFGSELRIAALDRNTAFSRKRILELAEIAVKDPSAARIALNEMEKSQMPLLKARHLELEKGSLVEIKCNKPSLQYRLGRVESFGEATVTVFLRDTGRMEMEKYRLKFQEVEPIALEKEPPVRDLVARIHKLRSMPLDPFEREILDLLDRRVALTPIEERYLLEIEKLYLEV